MDNEIEGLPAELIDRLIELIDFGEDHGGAWHEHGWWIEFNLGGSRLEGVFVDTGHDLPPDSVGVDQRRHAKTIVNRQGYVALLRNRLAELVLDGLDEAFLVRALRDELRRWKVQATEGIGEVDARRATLAKNLRDSADDPAEIAAFRSLIAQRDQAMAESKSDNELAEMMRKMADRDHLKPITPERVVDQWAELQRWDEVVAVSLPDEIFVRWRDLYAARVVRRGDTS